MLTPKQLRAIELLASEVEQKVIAKELGISDRTIQRWLKLDEFKNVLKGVSYRPVAVSAVEVVNAHQARRERLDGLLDKAIDTLEATLENPDARTSDKLTACKMLGDWTGASKRMEEIEAFEVLVKAGWVQTDIIGDCLDGINVLNERMRKALTSPPS